MSNNYHYTLTGAIKVCLSNSKNSAQKRLKGNRKEAGIFNLTYDNIMRLWNLQNGRCYHSGIPMNYNKNEWRISIDRLDNDKGYFPDNVVLCCGEFNGRKLWTQEKINEMLTIFEQDITDNSVNFDIKRARKKYGKVTFCNIDGIPYRNCTYCDEIKPVVDFTDRRFNACYKCVRRLRDTVTPESRMQDLLACGTTSTRIRQTWKDKGRDFTYNISTDFLMDLYNQQKGLCAYSGLPMKLDKQSLTNWAASLERKDVMKGYSKDNVCLVCCEFNTHDNTAKQTTTDSGCSGWSVEKFKLFLGYIWLKKGIIASEDELNIIIDMQKQTIPRKYNGTIRTKTGVKEIIGDYYNRVHAKKVYGQILLVTSPDNKAYVYKTDIIDQSIDNVFSSIKKAGHTVFIDEVAKCGKDAFTITPLLSCKKELLEDYQNMFIREYNTITPNGLNPSFRNTKEWNKKISDGSLKHGVGHDGRELPFYMKYAKWADRDGYMIVGHPKCKIKYFVNTPKTKEKKTYDELYDNCLTHLNQLNL